MHWTTSTQIPKVEGGQPRKQLQGCGVVCCCCISLQLALMLVLTLCTLIIGTRTPLVHVVVHTLQLPQVVFFFQPPARTIHMHSSTCTVWWWSIVVHNTKIIATFQLHSLYSQLCIYKHLCVKIHHIIRILLYVAMVLDTNALNL